ncbi:hypothetical protein [Methanobrevibacter sp.]|uniref:hypothetical protein n=1 Tax=Methanobrevibacter sp. TaxID=66852 RepID=UPI00388F47DF
MGLFSKTPEEKKLKELTGGFLLTDRYLKTLESYGVSRNMGYFIQDTVRQEIKNSKLQVDEIEPRLIFLIKQFSSIRCEQASGETRSVSATSEERTMKFLINQSHNMLSCPECSAKYLKNDTYCHKCGFKLK